MSLVVYPTFSHSDGIGASLVVCAAGSRSGQQAAPGAEIT
jgi:hypothetical protein